MFICLYKNTFNTRATSWWQWAAILAFILFLYTLFVSVFLPVCIYDMKETRFFKIEMLEDSSETRQKQQIMIDELRSNNTKLLKEIKKLQVTVGIHERLERVTEKDWSLATVGNKRHQNVLITSIPNSGELFFGDFFNHHRDVFYLFEPFHSLEYFKENRHPKEYTALLVSFLQGILACNFERFNFYAKFLSLHYRALIHRLASRELSDPPLCPRVEKGHYYNIRYCTKIQSPTLTAICKLHSHTVVKTTQMTNIETLIRMNSNMLSAKRILELVRDPRAILYTRSKTMENASDDWFAEEARKICRQQWKNREFVEKYKSNGEAISFTLVKYEDLVTSPFEVFDNLCRDLGLPQSKHARSWLRDAITKGFEWPASVEKMEMGIYSKTRQNLTHSLSEWSTGLSMKQVRTIEKKCRSAMKKLGYEEHHKT